VRTGESRRPLATVFAGLPDGKRMLTDGEMDLETLLILRLRKAAQIGWRNKGISGTDFIRCSGQAILVTGRAVLLQ
jgi:hypothetical protein